jgi:hypothetical protein
VCRPIQRASKGSPSYYDPLLLRSRALKRHRTDQNVSIIACRVPLRNLLSQDEEIVPFPEGGLHCGAGGSRFVGTDELVALHRHSDFEFGGLRHGGFHAPQDFSETANSNGRGAAGQRNQILDPSAYLYLGGRKETDAARTDVPRPLRTIDPLVAQLNNLKGQLQPISLGASLFQGLYCIVIGLPNQWV